MSRLGFVWIVVVGFVMVMGLSSTSRAEDGLGFAINCGGGCGVGTLSRPDLLMPAVPGGTFVITVAHLAPSPEDAFVRGRPMQCKPVEFRVDTIRIGARDGSVKVSVGEKQKLEAGKSARLVQDAGSQTGGAAAEMDQVAFRIRSERVTPRCELVAGGMLFEDASSTKPVPFSLLVSDGVKRLDRFSHR